MNFREAWSELLLYVPRLPQPLAKRLINRAIRQVYEDHPWSFSEVQLHFTSKLAIPITGTAINQSFNVDNGTATLATSYMPSAQLRDSMGRVFPIREINGTTLTIETAFPYSGSQTLQLVQTALKMPDDFLAFVSVYDILEQRPLRVPRRGDSVEQYLGSMRIEGTPYAMLQIGPSLYQFYPTLLDARSYKITYRVAYKTLSADADGLPAQLNEEVILAKAKALAAEWAISAGQKDADFKTVLALANANYNNLLEKAKFADRGRSVKEIMYEGDSARFYQDAALLQRLPLGAE